MNGFFIKIIAFVILTRMFYVNGKYLPADQAKISVLDLGLLRGYGVFDYLRTYRGQPFHLKDHLFRLNYSAQQIGLHLPHSMEEIESIVMRLLQQNNSPESSIKIVLTGGVSEDQMLPHKEPTLTIFVYPFTPFPGHYYTEGIKAITTRLHRILPSVKTTQYIPAILALQKGRLHNAQEALYLNERSELLEATTSNFFAFDQKGNLLTPHSEEILFGITREVLIQIASAHFPLQMRPIAYAEIPDFEEAFLTSSNKEVMPLIQIDNHLIGNGTVGEKTKQLMRLFAEYTQKASYPPLHISRYI
jgi:branched-chain amino acid aminotransferase